MKRFHIGDILSVTTGRLVSPRHIGGVYDILNHMTGDNLFTHQLPRAMDECAPRLLEQHPQLKNVAVEEVTTENWQEWLNGMVDRFGESLPVEPLPPGEHKYKDPLAELAEMMGS